MEAGREGLEYVLSAKKSGGIGMNAAQYETTPFFYPGKVGSVTALLGATVVTNAAGDVIDLGDATSSIVADFRHAHDIGSKLWRRK